MDPIRVFITDDHEIVRLALRTLLEVEPGIVVVGEAADGASAVDAVCADPPDVLLLDMRMGGMNGVEVCREVRARCPEVHVLVLTSFDEDDEVFGVLEAGACGYLLKDSKPDSVVQAIRAVAEGKSVFDSDVAARVIARPQTPSEDVLSDRELEVLRLMAAGRGNREIAEALWISEATVKTHVSHILRKLDASDRTQAVVAAARSGIVDLR